MAQLASITVTYRKDRRPLNMQIEWSLLHNANSGNYNAQVRVIMTFKEKFGKRYGKRFARERINWADLKITKADASKQAITPAAPSAGGCECSCAACDNGRHCCNEGRGCNL